MLELILHYWRSPIFRVGLITLATAMAMALSVGVSLVVAAPPSPPHPLQGFGECLQCHAPGKTATAVPADHAAYGDATCAACHPAAGGAAPAPAPAPAGGSTPAPAPVSGSTGAPGPAPAPGAAAPAAGAVSATSRDQSCLACHQDKNLSIQLSGGEKMSLFVDATQFRQSVHGSRLACTDCHTTISTYPHPQVRYESRRSYTLAYYESCKRCHFANYTKTLDSVHFSAMSAGDNGAPVCSDCHGAHYVAKPAEPRKTISEACGTCHTQVSADYAESVHGKALTGEDNQDVPACTTCHGVHSIPNATSASFILGSAQLCASCHENRELMAKYGLSPNVFQTYLDDFHGRTVGFMEAQNPNAQPLEPLCIDCHGIHDIKSAKDPDSPTIKANLQATCQKCHSDASPNFPSAWLAHYEPSPDKAPLVYYIRLYYWVLIPVMIGGLVLHIGLDLWRLARNR